MYTTQTDRERARNIIRSPEVRDPLLKFTNTPEEILALCSLPTELAQAA